MTMNIGITIRFQNSYFSGSIPQLANSLAKLFSHLGHSVTFLYPPKEPGWFMDTSPPPNIPCIEWSNTLRFDVLIEVVWALSPEDREHCATRTITFVHHPPIFHDMESSVYLFNPTKRNFKNLSAIWTYDLYSTQDVQYLEFVSGVKVYQVPYVWNTDALDEFMREQNIPTWLESAKLVESRVPVGSPSTLSWCLRVVESNFSNTSHCILPLNIISQIRIQGDTVRMCVHNGEDVVKHAFFQANVAKNLLLPDISGNMVPRVRVPDLRRDKTVIVAHQRFRPLKSFLLDALYVGIPVIHNCELLKDMGFFYEGNQIGSAVAGWKRLQNEYETRTGFFSDSEFTRRQTVLRNRYSPLSVSERYNSVLDSLFKHAPRIQIRTCISDEVETSEIQKPQTIQKTQETPVHSTQKELRVAFLTMWDHFQPKHNFFMYLLSWIGSKHNIRVVEDNVHPNLVICGPYNTAETESYPGVPRVHYTAENTSPNPRAFLNIGFLYDSGQNYIRMPLWVLEIDWWGANHEKLMNPLPVRLSDCLHVNADVLADKKKFCAFVATNPNNPVRNLAFQTLNSWKHVDAGGNLFCNLSEGPIPANYGGGGGGELAKVNFYKQYKYVLTFENSSSPGYTTEKLFHAKVAGCVPIYWGDPLVERDFDARGFLNANSIQTTDDLIKLVSNVDEEQWKKMASIPALSEYKKRWCERTMEEIAKRIFQRVLRVDTGAVDWSEAQLFGKQYEQDVEGISHTLANVQTNREEPEQMVPEKILVTAANSRYIDSVLHMMDSCTKETFCKIVYVWPDVSEKDRNAIQDKGGAIRVLDTSNPPWPGFWEPQHFAWKLWVHRDMLQHAKPGSLVLYLDSGVMFVSSIQHIWDAMEKDGIYLVNDVEQTNERWCHPTFRKNMNTTAEELSHHQIYAGIIGYKQGSVYTDSIAKVALTLASTQPETIIGEKWKPYTATCMGHRHDQSILSILTMRQSCPRHPLRSVYCDTSLRTAQQLNVPFYIHRGKFVESVSFAPSLQEAYVINLERRKDRLQRFNTLHPSLRNRVYVWNAVDGKNITLSEKIVDCFRNNTFGWKKSIMGCTLSHLGIWEKLANDTRSENYLVLEDDVKFQAGWEQKWAEASHHIPKDADVLFLGGVLPPNLVGLPTVTEPVNSYFARIKKNTLFGEPERRYFHFCTYSYVLTKQGAQKLVNLVKQKGIYMNVDHMIVNHGEYLNIYFTTPLLSTCYQDEDPNYKHSDFNNYNRTDSFDSDIWNNTDVFTKEELAVFMKKEVVRAHTVLHMDCVTQASILESQWLHELLPLPIQWTTQIHDILTSDYPMILYRRDQGCVKWIVGILQQLEQRNKPVTILHLSDEFADDPIFIYTMPIVKCVIRNYWRPDVGGEKILTIPLGYAQGRKGGDPTPSFNQRANIWSFAGSLDRKGRTETLETLRRVTPYEEYTKPLWDSPARLDGPAYCATLQNTKFVPCMRGSRTVESYRIYEALEHGAIPFYVPGEVDEIKSMYGNHPLLAFPSWETAVQLLPKFANQTAVMEKHRTTIQNWWKTKKEEMRQKLQILVS